MALAVYDGWSKVIRNLPAKVAVFEARILTKAVSDRVEPSVDTVMCPEAVAEGWGHVLQGLERGGPVTPADLSALG